MSLILSGTDGLSDVDGSAATPAIRGTDANTGIFFPAADTIAFSEGGVEAMRIDSSGNVGVGTSSPTAKLDVLTSGAANVALFRAGSGQNSFLSVIGNGNSFLSSSFDIIQDSLNQAQLVQRANAPMLFFTNNTERMRIDSSGNVGIGTTNPGVLGVFEVQATSGNFSGVAIKNNATGNVLYGGSYTNISMASEGAAFQITQVGGSGFLYGGAASVNFVQSSNAPMTFLTNSAERMRLTAGGILMVGNTTFTNANLVGGGAYIDSNLFLGNSGGTAAYNVRFDGFSNSLYVVWNNGTSDINSISYAYGGTAWVQTSDETLKDIIEPITDAANKVSTLRSVIGKFKTEEEGTRHPFLIAQDVQAVLPEAVYVNKSRVEGEPDTLGVGYTDVIPLLVAAIKELKALTDTQASTITTLTDRITALETP